MRSEIGKMLFEKRDSRWGLHAPLPPPTPIYGLFCWKTNGGFRATPAPLGPAPPPRGKIYKSMGEEPVLKIPAQQLFYGGFPALPEFLRGHYRKRVQSLESVSALLFGPTGPASLRRLSF